MDSRFENFCVRESESGDLGFGYDPRNNEYQQEGDDADDAAEIKPAGNLILVGDVEGDAEGIFQELNLN